MADEPQKPAPEFLDQTEVDQLIAPVAGPEPKAAGLVAPPAGGAKVEPYDFRNPAFLSEGELRRLRALHEEFIRYLGARLSLYLRMEFSLKLAALTTVAYERFCESLPTPAHVSLFKVEPLVGVGILDLSPRLALTIADRLLGGRGQAGSVDRNLTEIEIALLEDVVLIFLEEWCGQWKSESELKPALIGTESSGRFLQTSPKDAVILALTLECALGDCSEQIRIGVPYYTIEPLVKKLHSRRQKDGQVAAPAKRAAWQPAYDRISMPLRAEWQAFELAVREIASLRVGDVIEMPATMCHETRVLLNGVPKFIGTVGLEAGRVAIQLTRKLPAEDSSHAKPDGRKVT